MLLYQSNYGEEEQLRFLFFKVLVFKYIKRVHRCIIVKQDVLYIIEDTHCDINQA